MNDFNKLEHIAFSHAESDLSMEMEMFEREMLDRYNLPGDYLKKFQK
jgi:hypothetical protein